MKYFHLPLIATLLLTQVVQARLGETLDECVKRYGPLIKQQGSADNPQFIFEKDGIQIGINFLNGQAGQISYFRPATSPFLDSEVKQLLEVNSGGSSWHYDEAETNRVRKTIYAKQECFTRDDGGASAERLLFKSLGEFGTALDFVNITSSDYKKAIGAKNLPGF